MTGYTPQHALPYPEGEDAVAVHSDVQALAANTDATITRINWDKNSQSISSSDDLDLLPSGSYSIWNGEAAIALGLPEDVQFAIQVHRWGAAGGVMRAVARSSTPREYLNTRLSGGWAGWVRVDAGAVPEPVSRLASAGPGALKAAPLAFSTGYGGATTSGSGTTSVIQYLHPRVERMQLHLRNWNPRYVNADRAPATLTGVRIGRHTSGGTGTDWVDLPAGATAYASGWVDVPAALRGVEVVVQYSWSGSDVTRTLGTAWEGGRTNAPALWAWLEVEVPSSVPVVAAFGSSTAAGVGADRPVIDSWLGQWCREHDAIPALWAHSGDSASSWTASADRKWELYGTSINAPDAMIYAMGSNDWASGIDAAELQSRIEATVVELNQRVAPTIFGTTITPRRTPPGNDQARIDTNAWMLTSGLFRGVFDFAGAVALPDGTLDPAVDADGTHVTTAGHERLAAAINAPIVSPPGVTYLGDGVYEIS